MAVLQNSCFLNASGKFLKDTYEFYSPYESQVAHWRTAFQLKMSSLKDIVFRQPFGYCENTHLGEHLLMTASAWVG